MLKSLQLGKQIFSSNLIQGPLAGISCAPFRKLVWQFSQPAFCCTEMISCKTILYQAKESGQRLMAKSSAEGPVSFQLAANNPHELSEAVKIVTAAGADLIDLNCGCPVKKIRSKGAGSSLLSDASKLYQLIKAMKDNTHVPISIKIRVDGASQEKFNHEIVKVVQDAGVDFIVVHGRHWTEHYEQPCRYDQIQFFVDALKIPVIGNGDIHDLASLKQMFATGCAGIMIGRAGVGQPWLINQLMTAMQQQPFTMLTLPQQGSIFLEHIFELAVLLKSEKFAILQGRKFAKYYARSLDNRAQFVLMVNQCQTLADLKNIVDKFFNEIPSPLKGEG